MSHLGHLTELGQCSFRVLDGHLETVCWQLVESLPSEFSLEIDISASL